MGTHTASSSDTEGCMEAHSGQAASVGQDPEWRDEVVGHQAGCNSSRCDVKRPNVIALQTVKGESRIDSRLMAQHLGNAHRSVMALLDRYTDQFKGFGQVRFEMSVGDRPQGGGNRVRYALLNEDQAFFLLALSRNSDQVVSLKAKLVQAFREARQVADQHRSEYLPTYHWFHEEVHAMASGSSNVRFVHQNFNKLVNKAAGIEAGQRKACENLPQQALLILAQAVAANAVRCVTDHHEGYQRAKQSLAALTAATALLGSSVPLIADGAGGMRQEGQGG